MRSGLIVGLAAVIVVAVAVAEGLRSNRWGPTEDIQLASAKLERVPAEFGSWVSKDVPLDPKIIKVAEATGNVSRIYMNRKGERITVLLLCGPSGPIGAHTPEVCYGGIGYSCKEKPTRAGVKFAGGQASFWSARFEKSSANDDPLLVYWAWGVDGNWEATANPRSDFALRGALYKLYLVRSDNPNTRGQEQGPEPIESFLTDFLPVVKNALAPAPDNGSS